MTSFERKLIMTIIGDIMKYDADAIKEFGGRLLTLSSGEFEQIAHDVSKMLYGLANLREFVDFIFSDIPVEEWRKDDE